MYPNVIQMSVRRRLYGKTFYVSKNRINVVPIRLNAAELEALDKRVSKTGLSRSAILRMDFLDNRETVLAMEEIKNSPKKTVGR